jgi:hypothetical protein
MLMVAVGDFDDPAAALDRHVVGRLQWGRLVRRGVGLVETVPLDVDHAHHVV